MHCSWIVKKKKKKTFLFTLAALSLFYLSLSSLTSFSLYGLPMIVVRWWLCSDNCGLSMVVVRGLWSWIVGPMAAMEVYLFIYFLCCGLWWWFWFSVGRGSLIYWVCVCDWFWFTDLVLVLVGFGSVWWVY